MRLADLSINQPVFITMIVVVILVLGTISFLGMGLDLFPDISMPIVVIQTVYPGASPQEVESLVSKPIEELLSSLSRVQSVRSTSTESLSQVVIEFDMEYSSRSATDDVRERMAVARALLPTDARDPTVVRFDPVALPILTLAIADPEGMLSPADLRAVGDDVVKPRIERLDGVASVSVAGGLEREVQVDLRLDRVRAHNIPVPQIIGAIKAQNLNLPGGRLTEGDSERLLRTAGEFRSVDRIEAVQVPRPQGSPLLLRDLATVSDGYKEARVLSRLNGRDAVTLSVQKQSGTNTVRVADAVKGQVTALRQSRPDLAFTVVGDQSTFTRDANNDVLINLVLGGLLAAVVVFLFFWDLRNTLVTIVGLPVILLGAFAAMKSMGMSLNMMTLMALSLSVGMLIDDAMVVRENIFRRMEGGEEPRSAARSGTAEIALAVMATTFTIVAVFAPIAFVTGIAGKVFREFGLTVVAAVLISLVEAFTLAPMLSAHFFKPMSADKLSAHQARGGVFAGIQAGYRSFLAWSLRFRPVVVVISLVAFAGSLLAFPLLGQSFIPSLDASEFRINLELPAGSSLAQTDRAARQVEAIFMAEPEVVYAFAQVGSVEGGVEKATMFVKLKTERRRVQFVDRLRPQLAALPNLTYNIEHEGLTYSGSTSSTLGREFQINVRGQDLEELDRVSQSIVEALQSIPGAVDVDRSIRPGRPEAQVEVNEALAADLGVNTAQVATTVRALVNGETASKFRTPAKDYDIVVRLQESDRQNLADVLKLPITTAGGNQIPLAAVASVETALGPTQIERQDRQRQVIIGAGYQNRSLGEIRDDAQKAIAAMKLPPGVSVSFSGQAKYMDDVMQALLGAILLSVLFIYVVLASQFGSFVQPVIIMLSLPLSIVGAIGALLVAGKPFDMLAFIGIIMLMGLVTKNAILLIDFINNRRRAGMERNEAILAAAPIRLRPILMTTLAMIFGMIPTAIGLGTGSELRAPMGITVIGGLITSTVLTLLVVPVAYSFVDDLAGLFRAGRRGRALAARPSFAGALACFGAWKQGSRQ